MNKSLQFLKLFINVKILIFLEISDTPLTFANLLRKSSRVVSKFLKRKYFIHCFTAIQKFPFIINITVLEEKN